MPTKVIWKKGVTILELADRAAELFEKQVASEKRRLLDFVVSNCRWADGELTVKFRQPFDMIAVGATESIRPKAAGGVSNDLYPRQYTWVDAFRTSLISNVDSIRKLADRILELDLAV